MSIRRSILLTAAAMAMAVVPAFAFAGSERSCFTEDEVKAEQAVRLHSELMVIALTCRYSSEGVSLYSAYQNFTKKHITLLRDAEQTLMRHYRKSGMKVPESGVDKVRTLMGNEYSQRVADLSPRGFCDEFRDRVVDASTWSNGRVQQELSILADRYPCTEGQCSSMKTASAADSILIAQKGKTQHK